MRSGDPRNRQNNDAGVAMMVEYVMISAILMFLLVVMILLVNSTLMLGPSEPKTIRSGNLAAGVA